MKFPPALFALVVLAAVGSDTFAAAGPTNSASTNRILIIDSSSMPITGGKATLIIGPLQRADGIYSGDYAMKVSPYFYKNEKGTLAIIVSDAALAEIGQGKTAAIVGTATTSGKSGKSRHIDATATPADSSHGKLKLWFTAGDRKMVFEPAYHLADVKTTAVSAPPVETRTTSTPPRGAPEPAPKLP